MLYIVYAETDPETVGFNPEYLKAIPWLTKCKIFRDVDGKPEINIPFLDKKGAEVLWNICTVFTQEMVENLKELLALFLKGKNSSFLHILITCLYIRNT